MRQLSYDFYARDTVQVARALLGQRLVRIVDGQRLSGLITEVEAYTGPDDLASHARRRTPRSEIMYGPAGRAYVYMIYGVHFCLNAVCKPAGQVGAVLFRSIYPVEGIAVMRQRRGLTGDRGLTDGPGKVCQAMGIDQTLNGASLTVGRELFIEEEAEIASAQVVSTKRVGVRGDDLALARLWRFIWVGRPRR
jgi:DNA-3-methyladenine glycosylase